MKGPRAAQLRSTCPDEEGAAALHDSQDLKVSKERWWLLTCLKKANLGPLSPGYLGKYGCCAFDEAVPKREKIDVSFSLI